MKITTILLIIFIVLCIIEVYIIIVIIPDNDMIVSLNKKIDMLEKVRCYCTE